MIYPAKNTEFRYPLSYNTKRCGALRQIEQISATPHELLCVCVESILNTTEEYRSRNMFAFANTTNGGDPSCVLNVYV